MQIVGTQFLFKHRPEKTNMICPFREFSQLGSELIILLMWWALPSGTQFLEYCHT